MLKEVRTCCLCGKDLGYEFGNNPYPLKTKGDCCNHCNITKVIPARIEQASKRRSTK